MFTCPPPHHHIPSTSLPSAHSTPASLCHVRPPPFYFYHPRALPKVRNYISPRITICSRQNANPSTCSVKRVESLYDDLNRLKQIEPAGYRANVDAWRNALLAASKAGVMPPEQGKAAKSHFVMATGDQLLNALDTRQFGLPQSLGLVLVCLSLAGVYSLVRQRG
jgi:hypothetical protein